MHCFGGCSPDEIVAALGLQVSDLFFGVPARAPHARREGAGAREGEAALDFLRRKAAWELVALRQSSEALISAARGIDIDGWTDAALDVALDVLADAWVVLLDDEREAA